MPRCNCASVLGSWANPMPTCGRVQHECGTNTRDWSPSIFLQPEAVPDLRKLPCRERSFGLWATLTRTCKHPRQHKALFRETCATSVLADIMHSRTCGCLNPRGLVDIGTLESCAVRKPGFGPDILQCQPAKFSCVAYECVHRLMSNSLYLSKPPRSCFVLCSGEASWLQASGHMLEYVDIQPQLRRLRDASTRAFMALSAWPTLSSRFARVSEQGRERPTAWHSRWHATEG